MRDEIGYTCTFASEVDPDEKYSSVIWIRVTRDGDTIAKIAARRGHGELAHDIGVMNHIRSRYTKLRKGRLLKIPGTMKNKLVFDCHFQDMSRPLVKDGYAMFETLNRPGRVGITHFTGYNPVSMEIPIWFEAWRNRRSDLIEQKIATLERMAGRGNFPGAAIGPPAVIRVSTTGNDGRPVPVIPTNYQWSGSNPTAPLWRIAGIQWDQGALGDDNGARLRQTATVTLLQYTPITLSKTLVERAAAARTA